jgi:hypothetical protein
MNRIATLNGWCGSAIQLALFDQVQYTFPDRFLLRGKQEIAKQLVIIQS